MATKYIIEGADNGYIIKGWQGINEETMVFNDIQEMFQYLLGVFEQRYKDGLGNDYGYVWVKTIRDEIR